MTESDALATIWAKSPAQGAIYGEALPEHSHAAHRAATLLRARLGDLPGVGAWWWQAALTAALGHDAGKIASGFQRQVRPSGPRWGERHEVLSLGAIPLLCSDERLQVWIAAGIATHHYPLSGTSSAILARYEQAPPGCYEKWLAEVDPTVFTAWCHWLSAHSGRMRSYSAADWAQATARLVTELQSWDDDQDPSTGLHAVLLQGAVTLADHIASAHGTLDTTPPLAGYSHARQHNGLQLYEHQQRAGSTSGHLVLRGPTGSGKTQSGLLWGETAAAEIEHVSGGTARLVWTLPFLAATNAMADRLKTELAVPVGVLHSKSAAYHLARATTTDREEAARQAVDANENSRRFHHTARVATPWQLITGVLGGTRESATLLESANSVFVFDELHAYEPTRLGWILACMALWERLGSRIGVLSATMPERLVALLHETLHEPLSEVNAHADGTWPDRHHIRLRDHHLTHPTSIAEITTALETGRSVLVVANTVNDAITVYDQLAPIARHHHGTDAATLLHSRFRAIDRQAIETAINRRYNAHGPRQPGLVVATQTIEVSLDIDFDLLHTSAAPLEALIQRFGRINRLGEREPADVIVHPPQWTPRGNHTLADGTYPEHPVRAAWNILDRHRDTTSNETTIQAWIDEVYSGIFGDHWQQQVRRARDEFNTTFCDFTDPYADRSHLERAFRDTFDGLEAIWSGDQDHYRQALQTAEGHPGRLLAADYLIPLNNTHHRHTTWNPDLSIHTITGNYDPEHGLRLPR